MRTTGMVKVEPEYPIGILGESLVGPCEGYTEDQLLLQENGVMKTEEKEYERRI